MKTALIAALVLTLGLVSQQAAYAQAAVPRPAEKFTATDVAGKPLSLATFKGKVTVLQFLSVECPHCQKFSQLLTKFQADPSLKGFQAMGIAFDTGINAAAVTNYIKTYNVGMPVGYSDRLKVLNYLGISVMTNIGVPQIVIIDQKGMVRAQTDTNGGGKLGDETYLKSYLTSLLKEGSAGPGSGSKGGSKEPASAKSGKS